MGKFIVVLLGVDGGFLLAAGGLRLSEDSLLVDVGFDAGA